MKTLYIVRHAKSSWDYPELMDEERPLLDKGKKRTKKVVDFLLTKGVSLDSVKSSHAVRALETARIIAHAVHFPVDDIIVEKQIYHASAEQLFDQFNDLSDNIQSLMMVGHNPTFTNFANYFLDSGIEWLPTSGIVSISFDTESWVDVMKAKRKTNFVVYPKMI
ncbi:MAG: histidine phosphatase family protein [Bacteroidota bacterium]|nr:histidine phosphatase family protein [Bacteroidota bacterium]